MLKIGLVGAGRWGKVYIKTLKSLSFIQLVAVVSSNKNTKELLEKNCKLYKSVDDMLQNEKLDGIIIAIPPRYHFEILKNLIPIGIPILVEKPLTTSYPEAEKICRLVRKYKTKLLIDHIHIYSQAFQQLLDSLHLVGKINEIKCYAGNFGPYRNHINVLWDWSPHDISMLIKIFGLFSNKLKIIYLKTVNHKIQNAQTVNVKLKIDHISIKIYLSNHSQKKRKLIVFGEKGSIKYDDIKDKKITIRNKSNLTSLLPNKIKIINNIKYEKPLNDVLKKFVDTIQSKRISYESLKLSLEVIKIIHILNNNQSLDNNLYSNCKQ